MYTVDKYLAVCTHNSVSFTPTLSDTRWTTVKPQSVTASVVGVDGPMGGRYIVKVYPLINGKIEIPVETTIDGVFSIPQFSYVYSDDWNSVPHPNGDWSPLSGIHLKLLMGLPGKGIGNVIINPPVGVSTSDVKSTRVTLNNSTYINYTINSPTSVSFQTKPSNAETDYLTKSEITQYATIDTVYHDTVTNSDKTFSKTVRIVNDIKYIGFGQ